MPPIFTYDEKRIVNDKTESGTKADKRANIFFCKNHEVSDNRSNSNRASKVSNYSGLFCQKLSKSLLEAFVKRVDLLDLLLPGLFESCRTYRPVEPFGP